MRTNGRALFERWLERVVDESRLARI